MAIQHQELRLSLRRLTNPETVQAIAGLKARLTGLKDHIEATPEIRVAMVFTDRGCGHACRHCGDVSGRYVRGRHLPLQTLETAKKSGLLSDTIEISGGEPLDHPDIVELVRTFNGTIFATNGFSAATHSPESWDRILEVVCPVIDNISFHILDRWKGIKPGRDAVIRHAILARRVHIIEPMGEFGAEKQTALALLQILARLMDDVQLQEAVRCKQNVGAALSRAIADAIYGLPYLYIFKVGRGKILNGTAHDIALFQQSYTYLDCSAGDAVLLPDGSLAPRLLICEGWERPERVVFGHISEDASVLRQKFIACVAEYLTEKTNRPEDAWHAALEQMFASSESFLCSYEVNLMLKHDPVVIALSDALQRRYEELYGSTVSIERNPPPTSECITALWQKVERENYEFLLPKDSK